MEKTAGIVDTGTTLVLLPSGAFEAYKKATGATMDEYVYHYVNSCTLT